MGACPLLSTPDDRGWGRPELGAYLSQGDSMPVDNENYIVSTVVLLLRHRRPAAVPGRVGAIIVDTVERVLRGRLWAHIVHERAIVVSPSFADRNPSPAVARVGRVFRVTAPFKNLPPHSVKARDIVVSGKAVFQHCALSLTTPPMSRVESATSARWQQGRDGQALFGRRGVILHKRASVWKR